MKKKNITSKIFVFLVYLFLYLPVVAIIIASFNTNSYGAQIQGFTLDWYKSLWEKSSLIEGLQKTMIVGTAATLLSVMIGTLAAFGIYRFRFKGRALLDTLFYLPVVIPEIISGVSLMMLFSLCNIPTGMMTLIIAHTAFCIPYVVFNVKASIAGFDPSLEEASMDLGMSRIQTFFRITLPLILPGITSGAFMAFTLSIDDVTISFFTSGPTAQTLPIIIYNLSKKRLYPEIYALSTIMIMIVLVITVIYGLKKKKKGEIL